MSTFDIKTYFERFASEREALEVKWLNDSSCLVKFESEDFAKKAYAESALTSSLEHSEKLHIGEGIVDASSDQRNFDAHLGWKESLGFQLRSSGRWQRLWIRAGTDRDVKSDSTKGADSRFYQLQQKKKEKWLKSNGLFKPRRRKGSDEDEEMVVEQVGNCSLVRRVIRKKKVPGAFNNRGRREDSEEKEEQGVVEAEAKEVPKEAEEEYEIEEGMEFC